MLVNALPQLDGLQEKLGYVWLDYGKLIRALIHTTWANEHRDVPNQRMEFLGDSVLDLLSAEYLMAAMPDAREGDLSQKRANLVKTCALAQRARELGLGQYLQVGKGAEYLRDVESVLADLLEAIIGSAYLDGGMPAARAVAFRTGVLR